MIISLIGLRLVMILLVSIIGIVSNFIPKDSSINSDLASNCSNDTLQGFYSGNQCWSSSMFVVLCFIGVIPWLYDLFPGFYLKEASHKKMYLHKYPVSI